MAQWINLNRNNRSVIAHQYSALSEKAGPVLLLLVGLMAGWLTKCGKIFKVFYKPNFLYFYFLSYCYNFIGAFQLVFLNFKVCIEAQNNSVAIFFHTNTYYYKYYRT